MKIKYGFKSSIPNTPMSDALTVRESLVLDVMYEAKFIEDIVKDHMSSYNKGIYLKNDFSADPIISEHINYTVYPNHKEINSLDDLTPNISFILNQDEVEILNAYHIQNKHRFLSDKPSFPMRGLEIIKFLLYKVIYDLNPCKDLVFNDPACVSDHIKFMPDIFNYLKTYEEIICYVIGKEIPIELIDLITDIANTLIEKAEHFIMISPTYIHHVNLDGMSVSIGRSIDIRAYRYSAYLEHQRRINEDEPPF
jgi:hypothetical protein